MLEELLDLVKSYGQKQVVENPAIPNEYNSQVLGTAGSSIFDGLKGVLANGGLNQLMQLFSQGGRQPGFGGNNLQGLLQNPMVQGLIQSLAGKLINQFNVHPSAAQQVSSNLVPDVLNGLMQRVNNPGYSGLDMNSIIQSLTGGQMANTDFNNTYNRFSGSGMDMDGDGDVDLQDLAAMVSSAAGNNQSSESGSLMDMLSNFFK